jgi:hypothetical protein
MVSEHHSKERRFGAAVGGQLQGLCSVHLSVARDAPANGHVPFMLLQE